MISEVQKAELLSAITVEPMRTVTRQLMLEHDLMKSDVEALISACSGLISYIFDTGPVADRVARGVTALDLARSAMAAARRNQ